MMFRRSWLSGLFLVVVIASGTSTAAQNTGDAGNDTRVPSVSPNRVLELVAQHRGRVVIVNFWASWCPPCIEEFPDIIQVFDELHPQGLEVVAVSMNADDEIEDIDEFLARFQPPFPVYRASTYDETFFRGIADGWFGEMPVTFIVDAEGHLVSFHKRQVTYEELTAEVRTLLPAVDLP